MKKYGLVGGTLGHSVSPYIHSLFGDYDYSLMPMDAGELKRFVKSGDFGGINVTVPHKRLAFSICDVLSKRAKAVGSVNTVTIRDGKLYGDNTDYDGFLYMLSKSGISLHDKKVLVLGTGGTSLTVCACARDSGAAEVKCVSRTGNINYENVYDACGDYEVVINTTPVGMYPDIDKAPVDIARFRNLSGVADVVYNPLRTELIRNATEAGIPCTGGLRMLVAQAAYASEQFTGARIGEDGIETAYLKTLLEMSSIVLIGMPGSGKTTVAAVLASLTGRRLVDTDEMIVKKTGMSIPEIFEKYGEPEFRRLEHEAVSEASALIGSIISVGGGAVLDERNMQALKKNGTVVWLEREAELLATDGRPLSRDASALQKIKTERYPLYKKYSDIRIKNDTSPDSTAKNALEAFYEVLGN